MLPELDLSFVESESINCFALVAYLPDPLGRFFDDLRKQLVPGCNPKAHVTLLPPRPLYHPREVAWKQIFDLASQLPVFELEATQIQVFAETNVIYAEIDPAGHTILNAIHAELNHGALGFDEPFDYHPHITIAQELCGPEVPGAVDIARQAWAEYPHPRTFPVSKLTFFQNTCTNRWLDLASVNLR